MSDSQKNNFWPICAILSCSAMPGAQNSRIGLAQPTNLSGVSVCYTLVIAYVKTNDRRIYGHLQSGGKIQPLPSSPPRSGPLNPAKESRRAPSLGPGEPQPQTHYFSYILRQWNTETCLQWQRLSFFLCKSKCLKRISFTFSRDEQVPSDPCLCGCPW